MAIVWQVGGGEKRAGINLVMKKEKLPPVLHEFLKDFPACLVRFHPGTLISRLAVLQNANREIGVPRVQPIMFMPGKKNMGVGVCALRLTYQQGG